MRHLMAMALTLLFTQLELRFPSVCSRGIIARLQIRGRSDDDQERTRASGYRASGA